MVLLHRAGSNPGCRRSDHRRCRSDFHVPLHRRVVVGRGRGARDSSREPEKSSPHETLRRRRSPGRLLRSRLLRTSACAQSCAPRIAGRAPHHRARRTSGRRDGNPVSAPRCRNFVLWRTSLPPRSGTVSATQSSPHHVEKEKKARKIKRWKWGKANESSTNEMSEPR